MAALLARSRGLTTSEKEAWRDALPFMTADERRQLAAILAAQDARAHRPPPGHP
jgi:hypothetical protein